MHALTRATVCLFVFQFSQVLKHLHRRRPSEVETAHQLWLGRTLGFNHILLHLEALFARELAEVAVLAEAKRVVGPIGMLTLVGQLGPAMVVVARLTETFGVERLVRVFARCYLLGLSLLFLYHFAQLLVAGWRTGVTLWTLDVSFSLLRSNESNARFWFGLKEQLASGGLGFIE